MKKMNKHVAAVVTVLVCVVIGIAAACAGNNAHKEVDTEPAPEITEVSTPETATPETAIATPETAETATDINGEDVVEAEAVEEDAAVEETEDTAESEPMVTSTEVAEAEPEVQAEPDPEPVAAEEPVQETAPVAATPTMDIATECASRPNMIGRLRIPDVGINVALIAENTTEAVDAPDSAAFYLNYTNSYTIADHSNQNFVGIASCIPGSTIAYIDTPNGTLTYVCTGVQRGTNDGWYFWNPDGTLFEYGDLFMYTCAAADWHQVWLVTWAPC